MSKLCGNSISEDNLTSKIRESSEEVLKWKIQEFNNKILLGKSTKV